MVVLHNTSVNNSVPWYHNIPTSPIILKFLNPASISSIILTF